MWDEVEKVENKRRRRAGFFAVLVLALLATMTAISPAQVAAESAGGFADNSYIVDASKLLDAGDDHACAIVDGEVWCWGSNRLGQLGIGVDSSSNGSTVAVKVLGISNATAISAGSLHTCALTTAQNVMCWGSNLSGQLGDGTSGINNMSAVPVEVHGLSTAIAITAGELHSCAIDSLGRAACWGNGSAGQLGHGVYETSSSPVIALSIRDATAISAGDRHTCVTRSSGEVACWGQNSNGQLGNGSNSRTNRAVQVQGIQDAKAISSGANHTCAVESGVVQCWGGNTDGQLGNGTTVSRNTPAVTDVPYAFGVAAGVNHTCGIYFALLYSTAACWGGNRHGQLGDGSYDGATEPAAVVENLRDVVAITSGRDFSCALQFDGVLKCWGSGTRIGHGTYTDSNVAVDVVIDTVRSASMNSTLATTCHGLPVTVHIGAGQAPTDGDDVILGTPDDDVILALGGNDTVCGLGGDDTIVGGAGSDTLLGQDGNDTLFGRGGDDILSGADGNDSIVGGEGDDRIYANAGKDHLNGGPGNDLILGGPGNDYLGGKEGNDSLSGNSGDDIIQGHGGVDNIDSGPGADHVDGGAAIDHCTIDAADTVIDCP